MNEEVAEPPILDEAQLREVQKAKAGILAIAAVAFGGIVLMCLATAIIVILRLWG